MSDYVPLTQKGTPFADPPYTLRDCFAIAALQGLIINPKTVGGFVTISERAYELADAMIAERSE